MKILVMGLPGSGKTYLSKRLQKLLGCAWYNADTIRSMSNDWDFTIEGRSRQAGRMRNLADYEKSKYRTVICDFICPTNDTRSEFGADITIWMNTITSGRYDDTNKLFEPPEKAEYIITEFMNDQQIEDLVCLITKNQQQ